MSDLADLTLRLVREMRPETPPGSPPKRLVPYAEVYDSGFEDTPRRVPAIGRLRDATGWQPRHTLEDIVREMIRLHSDAPAAVEAAQP